MTKARSNATAKAAKGDLTVGSGTNLSDVLAVGNNGETLVADSSTSTGLRYQAPVQQNPVLNSAFQVWQRGTSLAVTSTSASFYGPDRWQVYSGSTGRTVSRQVTNDTTNLPNIQYCARVQRDSANTATNFIQATNMFETINTIPFVGKAIVYSFYARAGANFSSASSALGVQLVTGTGTDQNSTTGFTGAATPINSTATLTTTWQRFSFTTTIATSVTQIALATYYTPVGTAGANDYYEVTGVQLEVGSVATPFKTYAGTLQGELAACQRYYFRTTAGDAYGTVANYSFAKSATEATFSISLPVTMRTKPSSVDFANVAYLTFADTVFSVTSITLNGNNNGQNIVGSGSVTAATAGLTGRMTGNNNAAGYLGFSAEL